MVRDAHCHTEVETYSACGIWCRESGHTAHVLGYGECVPVQFVNQHIRKSEVDEGVLIDAFVEVDVVAAEIDSEAVVPVDHTGDAVETETVQPVFLHPELAVAQEEVEGLVLAVVEASGAPGRMMALRTGVEVEVFPAVEASQAFSLVLHAVGVDYVHHDGQALPVGVIDQALELFRRAEPRAEGVEIRHLIAE